MDYTDLATVKNYLLKEVTTPYESQINTWITALSRAADNHCNRVLAGDTPGTNTYDGNGEQLLVIDDCVALTEVRVDGVVMSVYEYPQNKEHTSRIVLEEGYKFTKGQQNVEVDAIHAMSQTVSPELELAVTILVAGLVKSQILGDKAGVTKKIGNFSITYPQSYQAQVDQAFTLLSSFKRIAL